MFVTFNALFMLSVISCQNNYIRRSVIKVVYSVTFDLSLPLVSESRTSMSKILYNPIFLGMCCMCDDFG